MSPQVQRLAVPGRSGEAGGLRRPSRSSTEGKYSIPVLVDSSFAKWRVITRHVVRNALIPIVTVAALNFGGLLGGAIITETIFTLDGMGFYFITKLRDGDVYAIMAYLVITSVAIIFFNLVADLLYGFLDPRIRYE